MRDSRCDALTIRPQRARVVRVKHPTCPPRVPTAGLFCLSVRLRSYHPGPATCPQQLSFICLARDRPAEPRPARPRSSFHVGSLSAVAALLQPGGECFLAAGRPIEPALEKTFSVLVYGKPWRPGLFLSSSVPLTL